MSDITKKVVGAIGGTAAAAVIGTKVMFPGITSDIQAVFKGVSMKREIMKAIEQGRYVIDAFEEWVEKTPKKPFIIYEDRIYTYEFVDMMANKVANLALTWNLNPNDTVASMITNEPAFVWTFLGLLKVGLADAFVNFNLTSRSLLHSIKTSEGKVLIVGAGDSLYASVLELYNDLPSGMPVYVYGRKQEELPVGFLSMDNALLRSQPTGICKSLRSHVTVTSSMAYIYTSGTTGLPKAAIVNHFKSFVTSKTYRMINFTDKDIVYIVTPLYHGVALFTSFFSTVDVGATFVLRNKFSASQYFEDVRKHKVTVLQYIGELFRYIVALPETPLDGVHKVRAAMGNGLRPDVWEVFQKRFKIPWVVEFFGASEGAAGSINLNNKIGACGRMPPLFDLLGALSGQPPVSSIIKYDPIEEKVIRDKNGLCIKVKPGEQGLMIGSIPPLNNKFYKGSKEMNEKKIIRNVFNANDAFFNFGDMMYLDKDYYMYFRDRVGDTFRWKGENVSTREVCDVLSTLKFIEDVNVYGVQIQGTEGRAGMASIILKENVKPTADILSKIYKRSVHDLPSYARPMFLRFQDNFTVTQTWKHKKVELVSDGFDPRNIKDPLFLLDTKTKTYIPLTINNVDTFLQSRL